MNFRLFRRLRRTASTAPMPVLRAANLARILFGVLLGMAVADRGDIAPALADDQSVLTYHGDAARTGAFVLATRVGEFDDRASQKKGLPVGVVLNLDRADPHEPRLASRRRLTLALFLSFLCVAMSLPVTSVYVSTRLGFSNALAGLAVGVASAEDAGLPGALRAAQADEPIRKFGAGPRRSYDGHQFDPCIAQPGSASGQ